MLPSLVVNSGVHPMDRVVVAACAITSTGVSTYLMFLVIEPMVLQYLELNSSQYQKYVVADYMN